LKDRVPIPLPDAVLFDLDGTLVDSLDDIAHALNAARADAGLDPSPRDRVRGWIGGGAGKLVARSLGHEDETSQDVPALLARFLHVYGTESGTRSPLLPGAAALLDALAARGVLLACTTNKPAAATDLVLRALGIADRFGAVVTPDTIPGVRKPDARFFGEALARLGGIAPARALVVGDGVPDVAGGRALGAPTVAVLGGYGDRDALLAAGPDFVVEATADLRHRLGL
jgi:phosphoglycolate phosphatase